MIFKDDKFNLIYKHKKELDMCPLPMAQVKLGRPDTFALVM